MAIGTLYKIMDAPSEDIFIDIDDYRLFENPDRPFDWLERMDSTSVQNTIKYFHASLKVKGFEADTEPCGKMLPYFVATQEAIEKWFAECFYKFKDRVAKMTLIDFTHASDIFALKEMMTKTNDYVLYQDEYEDDKIIPIDTFLREYADEGKTYYITDAVVMH